MAAAAWNERNATYACMPCDVDRGLCRFTHVVVDELQSAADDDVQTGARRRSSSSSAVVMFLATLEGRIHKYSLTHADDRRCHVACLLEVIHVTPAQQPQPIRTLVLLQRQVRYTPA